MEYYSAIKMKEILPFAATWMDLKNLMFSEMSGREIQTLYDITYIWNLKIKTNEYIYIYTHTYIYSKNRKRLTDIKN